MQFDGPSALLSANADGAPFGALTSVSIDEDGYITALFDNGIQRKVFKLPIASFANPDGLLARPGNGDQAPRRELLETVLFESGRPLIMSPPVAPSRIGSNIVIAWNGSTETARAISFAMPLLKAADRVLVVTVEGGMVEGPSGAELRSALLLAGITAESRHAEAGNQPTGKVILDLCQREGADLLIKGAYTNSRLRQLIFGGATDHILVSATLPVFFAH